MGSKARRPYVVIAGALALLVALSAVLGGCGGSSESAADSFHESFHEWKTNPALSDGMEAEAIAAAEEEQTVKELLAGQSVEGAEATRFLSSDDKTLIGATVTLHLSEPIEMHSVEVPVWLTPGPHPSKRPIPILRAARYSGTGIDELRVIVSMPTREMLELQPFGAAVDPPELTSSAIPGYKKVGDHGA